MIHPAPLRVVHLACILLLLACTGCASCALQIEPVSKKSPAIVPSFKESLYTFDRDHNLNFIMRSSSVDAATGKTVEQIATFRVFWRPIGGTTSMNPTSLNATYRYVLITPDSVGMYEGAGFVRLWGKNGAGTIQARLMDGDLRLTQASGNFVDTLGRARIRGNFSAAYDDARALDMQMAAHREFFARSLLSKPAPASTEPDALPDNSPDESAPLPATPFTPPPAPATQP